MEFISLDKIIVSGNKVSYCYFVSENMKKYFTNQPFSIEYPESVEVVPLSILSIPFVCNVLPIIWITDSVLELEEIDKAFFDSIPEFKNGYVDMYRNVALKGSINAKRIVNNSFSDLGKAAMFYSGGLDSALTLISHYKENPFLLSIWGSDINYDNEAGWSIVHSAIEEASARFGLSEAVFKSTFRVFDNEAKLSEDFSELLGDGWWHGIKHSLALLGHVAPYAFLHRISKMYIASTLCNDYGFAKCASVPEVDNNVRFSSCRVFHDGYLLSRQQKAKIIVDFFKEEYFPLHVCWRSQLGHNCCVCEKCYRTMANIWAEGGNIEHFGFSIKNQNPNMIRKCISNLNPEARMQMYWWKDIQKKAKTNKHILKKNEYYDYFSWIIKADFDNPNSIYKPKKKSRIKKLLSRLGLH